MDNNCTMYTMKAFISLTAWAAALGSVASNPTSLQQSNEQPHLLTRAANIEERATCKPINYTFQVTVPGSGSNSAPTFSFAGFTYRLPQAATFGQLISFYGNFANNQTTTSQVTTISNSTSNDDPNAPSRSSATGSKSTLLKNRTARFSYLLYILSTTCNEQRRNSCVLDR